MQSSTAIKAAAWLRDTGPAGITALARDLKLSRTSVENALAVLQRHDLILEVPGRPHGAGRPARHYVFHAAGGMGSQMARAFFFVEFELVELCESKLKVVVVVVV